MSPARRDWIAAIDATKAAFGGLDVVVNAAGISFTSSVANTELEDWNRVIGINQTGTFLGCKHGMLAIAETGRGGAIVNISSVQGIHAHAASFVYNTTKAAVRMMSKSVALSGALFQPPIRCNTVLPGYVDTPILAPGRRYAGRTRSAGFRHVAGYAPWASGAGP